MTDRPSIYEFVGGAPAFLTLASALNERCLADPVLNHPFSHQGHPEHLQRLAEYLGEVFGGPALYSVLGGHSAMLTIHANTDADDDLGARFIDCFDNAVDDAKFSDDPALRRLLHQYMTWATSEVHRYSPHGSSVSPDLEMPHWSWDGPVSSVVDSPSRRLT
jgi:hemoglobin